MAKKSKRMVKVNFKLIIFAVLLVFAVFYLFKNKPRYQNTAVNSNTPVVVEEVMTEGYPKVQVRAENGRFFPRNIDVKHTDTVILDIKAIDRDYKFVIDEFRINKAIPKGKTTEIKIEGLGVGEHKYICGDNCSGKIEVEAKTDEED